MRVATATILLAAGFARAAAQVPAPVDPEARFDVASIRPGNVEALAVSGGIGVRLLPNGMSAGFSTVRMLILAGVSAQRLPGDWRSGVDELGSVRHLRDRKSTRLNSSH